MLLQAVRGRRYGPVFLAAVAYLLLTSGWLADIPPMQDVGLILLMTAFATEGSTFRPHAAHSSAACGRHTGCRAAPWRAARTARTASAQILFSIKIGGTIVLIGFGERSRFKIKMSAH